MDDGVAEVFGPWRARARALLDAGVNPEDVSWPDAPQPSLALGAENVVAASSAPTPLRIAASLMTLLEAAACHRDPLPHATMYRVLWRAAHGERGIAADRLDADVARLAAMEKSVRRDTHKMTAFVRFREVIDDDGEPRYVAWHVPEHRILRRAAPFFVRRFGTMRWTIATPDGTACWDRRTLAFVASPRVAAPSHDADEALWLTYYRSIFNPARLNVRAMRREMPQRYWATLPEARLIPALIASAPERAGRMLDGSAPFVAPSRNVNRAAHGDENTSAPRAHPRACARLHPPAPADDASPAACRRCELAESATRAVPGEGPVPAALMLVGEQPGDEEDLAGRPFVGPAGRMLRNLLARAGIDASAVYITNAVKHFRFEPRGKRRIHKTPLQRHVAACRDWLDAEIARARPTTIVALGATALSALAPQRLSVAQARGQLLLHPSGARLVATYHPSALLRADDPSERRRMEAALLDDLALAQTSSGARASAPAADATTPGGTG